MWTAMDLISVSMINVAMISHIYHDSRHRPWSTHIPCCWDRHYHPESFGVVVILCGVITLWTCCWPAPIESHCCCHMMHECLTAEWGREHAPLLLRLCEWRRVMCDNRFRPPLKISDFTLLLLHLHWSHFQIFQQFHLLTCTSLTLALTSAHLICTPFAH